VTLGQITEKSNRGRIKTILHIVLKFPFDRACFHRREASANFDISNCRCLQRRHNFIIRQHFSNCMVIATISDWRS